MTVAPVEATPVSATLEALVVLSVAEPEAGDSARALMVGAAVSRVKDRSNLVKLPFWSIAVRCKVCAPSASVPPASVAIRAAETVKLPLASSVSVRLA